MNYLNEADYCCFAPPPPPSSSSNQQHSSPGNSFTSLAPVIAARLREQLLSNTTVEVKRELAVLVYLQLVGDGRVQSEAAEFSARLVDVTPRTVRRWYDVVADHLQNNQPEETDIPDLQPPPSLLQQHGRPYRHQHSQHQQQQHRKWLLEDYPELLERAKGWLAMQWARVHADQNARPFKITEFQDFVNEDLIRPLFDSPENSVQPISHSTARSWLKRLGYYEEKRKLERSRDQQQQRPGAESSNWLMASSAASINEGRKRAKTWSGSIIPFDWSTINGDDPIIN
jgi:hypothetical protein